MASSFERSTQKLIQYIPWDQQLLNAILIGTVGISVFSTMLELQVNEFIALIYMGALLYILHRTYPTLSKHYKRQLAIIVNYASGYKEATLYLQNDINVFKNQTKQVAIQYQLIFTSVILMTWAYLALLVLQHDLMKFIYTILQCASISCQILFCYITIRHYKLHYQIQDTLPYHVYIVNATFFILGLVFWKYVNQKTEQLFISVTILFDFILHGIHCSYSISRFGTTSNKSLAYYIIGALFQYLAEVLKQVLMVQRKHLVDIHVVAQVLLNLSFYVLITGVLLHAKAFLDYRILEFKIRYKDLEQKPRLDNPNQTYSTEID